MGISTIQEDEARAKDEDGKIRRGEGEGKSDLLGDRVALGNQRVALLVKSRQEVHLRAATLEGRVVEDKG